MEHLESVTKIRLAFLVLVSMAPRWALECQIKPLLETTAMEAYLEASSQMYLYP